MSATSLLLDGQDLDDLFARAGELEGWVVRVERVRRSGVAGLLGARRYELTLDVDGAGEPRDDVSTLGPPPWVAPHPDAPPAEPSASAPDPLTSAPDPLTSARVQRYGGLQGSDEPVDVALGEGVGEVPAGATAVMPGLQTPTVGLPAGAPVPSRTPNPDLAPGPTDPAAPAPEARVRRCGGPEGSGEPRNVALGGMAALLAAADGADERLGSPAAVPVAAAAPAVAAPARSQAETDVPQPPRLDQLEELARPERTPRPVTFPRLGEPLVGRPLAAPSAGPACPLPTAVPTPPPTAPAPRPTAVSLPERLRALGVPSRLVPPDPNATSALLSLAARLPAPPVLSSQAGAVVAVVGAGDVVLETCAQMLAEVTAAAVRLVIVGDIDGAPGLPVSDPAVAARLRCDSGDALVVVAVAATTDVERLDRAAEVLDALGPDQTWAALDGRRPRGGIAADLAAAAETVGELDALAVQGAGRCTRPGLLLGLGLPVGWLDGRPATPLAWAALLEDALRRAGADGARGVRTG